MGRKRFVDLSHRVAGSRLGRAVGVALVLSALVLHKSENREVAGRWSTVYSVVLAVVGLVFFTLLWRTVRAWRKREYRDPERSGRIARAAWLDAAIVLFGGGYLLDSVRDPTRAARLLDLDLIGGHYPDVVVLGWLACASLAVASLYAVRTIGQRAAGPALLLGSLLCTFVVLEGVARAAAIVAPQIQGFPTSRSRMWELRHVRRNSAGFRDSEHALKATPGTRRLLLVGDSYAYGAGIDLVRDRFGDRLAHALADATGVPWEVVTMAKPDTHTRDHLEFLEQGIPYKPDVVLLLYVFNDIDYLAPVTPRTVLTEHPQTIVDRVHPLRAAIKNSFLAQELYVRWRHVRFASPSATAWNDPYRDSAVLSMHLEDLRAFGRRATSNGAKWAIVPFDIAVVTGPAAAERYQRFMEACREANLPVWSLADAFHGTSFDALRVNRLDGHPGSEANRLAAAAILPRLLGR
jgi:hypothetical protein